MALIKWDPFEELAEMQNKMSRYFDEDTQKSPKQLTIPTTDIYDENGSLVIESEIPNFSDKEIDVDIANDVLEIRAEGKTSNEEEAKNGRRYVLRESSSSYYRRIGLPKGVNTDEAKATYENGVLRVVMPKEEQKVKKRLKVNK